MGHIENFFAFMSCSIEQMGHKKEVLRHMSQSQREEGHKTKFKQKIKLNINTKKILKTFDICSLRK